MQFVRYERNGALRLGALAGDDVGRAGRAERDGRVGELAFAGGADEVAARAAQLALTEPLSAAQLDSIMPTRRTATTTQHIGNYFRISPDDRLIWGGRARFAFSNPTEDARSGEVLRAQLMAWRTSCAWAATPLPLAATWPWTCRLRAMRAWTTAQFMTPPPQTTATPLAT
jgi:glycine/D-amino acid oxidase-like deaminating enzyme